MHLLHCPFVTYCGFMGFSVSTEIPTKRPWWQGEVSGNMLCLSFAWENICQLGQWVGMQRLDGRSEQGRNAVCWFFTYLHGCFVLKLTAHPLVAMDVVWHLEKTFLSSARGRGAVFGRDHTAEILKGAGLRCSCLLSVLASSSFWSFQEWPCLFIPGNPATTMHTVHSGPGWCQLPSSHEEVHGFYQNCPFCCQQTGLSTSLLVAST